MLLNFYLWHDNYDILLCLLCQHKQQNNLNILISLRMILIVVWLESFSKQTPKLSNRLVFKGDRQYTDPRRNVETMRTEISVIKRIRRDVGLHSGVVTNAHRAISTPLLFAVKFEMICLFRLSSYAVYITPHRVMEPVRFIKSLLTCTSSVSEYGRCDIFISYYGKEIAGN